MVASILFCIFLLLLSSFLHFLLFVPFLVILGFLISCVLTTSPHLPSSDPSGPETPSFSAHHPLLPPEVLTPRHTALCAAVHTLGFRRSSLPKRVCPLGGALVGVCVWLWGWSGYIGIGACLRGEGCTVCLPFKLKQNLCCCCCCEVASVVSDSVRPHRRQQAPLANLR